MPSEMFGVEPHNLLQLSVTSTQAQRRKNKGSYNVTQLPNPTISYTRLSIRARCHDNKAATTLLIVVSNNAS